MTSLFDPMTNAPHSNSPTLDMLDGALEPEKHSPLQEAKVADPTQVGPEPETVTVTVSTVGEEGSIVGQQANQQFADPNALQFQYRTDANGQVSATGFNGANQQIRVVHVQANDPTAERVDATGAANFGQQPQQAVQTVIQSPFSNGSPQHPDTETAADGTRFTYFHPQTDGGATANVVPAGTADTLDTNSAYTVRNIPVSLTQPSSPSQITMAESQTITTVGTAAGRNCSSFTSVTFSAVDSV